VRRGEHERIWAQIRCQFRVKFGLRGASYRSSHVRNAPLATVGLKKAACR